MPLTLTESASIIPNSRSSAAAWSKSCAQSWATPTPSRYRGLTELMTDQAGGVQMPPAAAPTSRLAQSPFPLAIKETQADLAEMALHALFEKLKTGPGDCQLVLYAATSVDEDFYSSVLGRLAGKFNFAHLPHFGLSQLQSASLFAGIAIADAILREAPHEAALFVAAEKWPLPAPRLMTQESILADGAAALWLTTSSTVPGLKVIGTINRSGAPFVSPGLPGAIQMERIMEKLVPELAFLLQHHVAEADRENVLWLEAGLGGFMDDSVRMALGGKGCAREFSGDTAGIDLCCVSAPQALSEALHAIKTGGIPPQTYVVAWGISFGGAIGATLFQAIVEPDNDA